MKHSFRIIQLLTVSSLISAAGISQNVSSPYSIIGIGDIEHSYFNRNSGMANTGLSLRSGQNLYQANPASYSALNNQFFTFEFATQGKTVKYSGDAVDPLDNTNGDFTFKKVTAGFKVMPRWGMGVGLSPFSSVNYQFNLRKEIVGTNTFYQSAYEGTGGINQLFWGNAYRISKNFSVGVNSAFLFGSIKQSENILDPTTETNILSTKNIYYRKLQFTYGVQYFAALSKSLDYNLGITFSPENKMNGETSLEVISDGELIRDEKIGDDKFTLPNSFGVGMSVTKNKNLTIAADYRFQNWSATNYRTLSASLVNSHRYSVGVDYSKLRAANNFLYERFNLQAGMFMENSYLSIKGKQLTAYGVTIGGGLPVSGRINLNVALEAGTRGTTTRGLIKENYAQLTLNISYRDFWYTKGRKYD